DRRIIERYQLRAAAEEWRARGGKLDIFDWHRPLFEKINDDFNGEIFKPTELLERTRVDSEILARIIERLYPPESPYRFDVLGVELLGSIYERYLGKTIRVTAQQVRVEEKPQVHPLLPDVIKDANGEPRLSVVRKAGILRNNLFGVDIDPQAVEITMMSLYLKALEGEKSLLPPNQSLLPELKYNVLCGNSLI